MHSHDRHSLYRLQCDHETRIIVSFLPRDAMLARSLRQRRVRTSVRLSVTRRYCAKTDTKLL